MLEIQWDALFVFTMLVDLVFVIDMVLQFVTMYPRTTARGLEWELNPRKIAMNYLRTAFCQARCDKIVRIHARPGPKETKVE